MLTSTASTIDQRITKLERETRWWRFAALGAVGLLGVVAATAFQPSTKPIDAESLTLRGPAGAAVTLSITAGGDLEARFERGTQAMRVVRGSSLVLVDPDGRTIARLGSPIARQLAP